MYNIYIDTLFKLTKTIKEISIMLIWLIVAMFYSCSKPENKLNGLWQIETAYYHNQPVKYDLSPRVFDLKDDRRCDLPVSDAMTNDSLCSIGLWSTYERADATYLNIKTKNTIFNRKFKISNYHIIENHGSSKTTMTLSADSLKIDCSRIIF
jgi:hypothetical protein